MTTCSGRYCRGLEYESIDLEMNLFYITGQHTQSTTRHPHYDILAMRSRTTKSMYATLRPFGGGTSRCATRCRRLTRMPNDTEQRHPSQPSSTSAEARAWQRQGRRECTSHLEMKVTISTLSATQRGSSPVAVRVTCDRTSAQTKA